MKENLLLENAKVLAECNGISYMELARKIGLNQNYFYMPHNLNGVAIGVVIALAELFDVSVESLLHEDMREGVLMKEIEKCRRKIIRLEKRLEDIRLEDIKQGGRIMEEKIMNLVGSLTDEQKLQLALYALVTLDFGVEVMENGVVLNDEWNEHKDYLTNKQMQLLGWHIRRTVSDVVETVVDMVNDGEKR